MPKSGWTEFNHSFSTVGNEVSKSAQPKGKLQVRVQRIRSGKRGKLVTVVRGLAIASDEAKKLLKKIKTSCGTGGTLKEELLEFQGDQVKSVMDLLYKEGYRPKQSGG